MEKMNMEKVVWITAKSMTQKVQEEIRSAIESGKWVSFYGDGYGRKARQFEKSGEKFLATLYGDHIITAYGNNGYSSGFYKLKEEN